MTADEVRERAYAIWEQDGRRHGNDWAHWFQAEAEVLRLLTPPKEANLDNSAAKPTVELELDEITRFITEWRERLLRQVGTGENLSPLSKSAQQHIQKRVPPSTLQRYLNRQSAIQLLLMDLESIGTRIFQYQFIGAYNSYFVPPSPEIGAAFLSHLHILRPSELYMMLERGADLLRFATVLAFDIGLNSVDQSNRYAKSVRKGFDRRLRERHRLVHAHERPSLSARILEMPINSMPREEVGEMLGLIGAQLVRLYLELNDRRVPEELTRESLIAVLEEMKTVHFDAFEHEARNMWELISSHFEKTFKTLSNV
jgi:hypothetical protein